MLHGLIDWWARQMLGLIPTRLRRPMHDRDAIIAELAGPGDRLQLFLRRDRRETPLGSFAEDEAGARAMAARLSGMRRPARILLRLQQGLLLERDVALPLAAERDPAGVLAYDMDRNTPFSADDVFWSWAIIRRDAAQARLLTRLSLVPKRMLAPALSALSRAGLAPRHMLAPALGGEMRLIGLDDPRPAWSSGLLRIVLALCVLLAVVAVALPLVLQARAQNALDAEMAGLRPRVAQVENLRREASSRSQGADMFATQRARLGEPLQVLATLTDLLPDDTFLTGLSLRDGTLTFEGVSAAAARLIGTLSADPVLRDAAFTAPVTRTPDARTDQFSIRAQIAR